MHNLRRMGFYFITDSTLTKKGIVEDVKAALEAGVKIIQYREKNKPARTMFKECSIIKRLCVDKKAVFLVNDRVDIALAVDAGGVHLGQEDIPCSAARLLLGEEKIIGITAHSAGEAVEAEKAGADYVGASPIFATRTKKDAGKQAGLKLIRDIKENVRIPVVAIGGIKHDNIRTVMEAGADSAGAISAVVTAKDSAEACKVFMEIINGYYRD